MAPGRGADHRGQAGERVLDLAAGTGTSTLTFTATGADGRGLRFLAGDASSRSYQDGRWPGGDRARPARWVAGDALRLPFRDGAFDAVTISFGLRNVADNRAAQPESAG